MDKFAAREFYTVVIGGSLLSTLAGFINAAVLTGSFHVAVTHVTGSLTRLGSSLATANWPSAGQVSGLTLCFFLGSATAGATIDSTRFQLGRSYGIALLVEAAILVLAWVFFNVGHPAFGSAAAAYACGLQNAFCTGYSGAVLRTTHMTGITTDLGILFGQIIARNPRVESWKIKVFGPLWIGYLVGGILGTWGTLAWGDNAILVPAVILCMAGVFYLTWGPAREARE
ncbi:putative transmembrane protein, partial [Catenaria anguillulae PL171]